METDLDFARNALATEAASIQKAADRLDQEFTRAVELLDIDTGKIVVAGIGKSGHVGRKIAATFCSTGSPAVFMHGSEASHGDLGIHQAGDPVVLLSNSGSTAELLGLVPSFVAHNSSLIGILGNPKGPLAAKVDVVLDASVDREADPLDIVPTASFSVTAAIGDALAGALMLRKSFTKEDYAKTHPGGQLGRNLNLDVGSLMHSAEKVACCSEESCLRDLVIAMTEYPLGAACVLSDGKLEGIITDGDLRRALLENPDIMDVKASKIMTPDPTTISPAGSAGEALRLMENRVSQISVLPVVESDGNTFVGLLRLHDIYSPAEG